MRITLSILFLSIFSISLGQRVTVSGIAPAYVGKQIEACIIEDYFSMKESMVATTTVAEDSTFTLYLDIPETQKIVIRSMNNKGFILVQPNANYSIFFPEKDKFTPNKPSGNDVEIGFFDLDSTDINYKILGFQRWVDHFIGNFYHLKSVEPIEFTQALDRFKTNAENAYIDDTSTFLKVYVKYTMAGLDNINTASERNRYEKYDFYIKKIKAQYKNEAYMSYVKNFYQQLIPRLSNETNQAVYEGVVQSSPTLVMRALGTEYTMSNLRIREMIMISMLSEAYHMKDFPQTNILTILDSLSTRTYFKEHQTIAVNLKERITQLVPGGEAPSFVLIEPGKPTKTLLGYQGKHVYLHFFDPSSDANLQEVQLLKESQEKYGDYVQFISIYRNDLELSEARRAQLESIPWDVYALAPDNPIWRNYQIKAVPSYTLIDAAGYVVMSPALGPTPNGQYETIDKTLFYIKKTIVDQN